jgi:hypothetical protein
MSLSLRSKSSAHTLAVTNSPTAFSFKSPFCEKNGSDVGDDMSFKLYLQLLGKADPSTGPLDVYFKTKKIFSPIDQTTQDVISEKLDLAFQVRPQSSRREPVPSYI